MTTSLIEWYNNNNKRDEANKEDEAMTIKDIRKKTGLSQAKFAEKFEIPKRTIENWETGERVPAQYIVDMLAYIVALEGVKLTAYVFSEYRDSFGTGSEKLFASRDEAIRYAKEEWDHLSIHDQNSYKNDPAGSFCVTEAVPVIWDDVAEEFYADMSSYDIAWSAF